MLPPALRSPSRLETRLLWFFFLGVLPLLGFLTEYRSAFLERRMGDVGVFFRAGWAVVADADPYAVTCNNDWHYNYPPLFAILMAPLADPPQGMDTAGYLPFAWSVAIFFLVSVLSFFWGVHALASALEATSDDAGVRVQPRFCRRWWYLRMLPVLVCFFMFGHTLVRGQVNTFVIALLCLALAGWLRGQNFRAGAWLSLAICIKVIPVYLLVYPLWKRDYRGLAGCTVGLFVGLVLVPLLVFGPTRTQTHYETYTRVFFAPLFKLNDDDTRHSELLGMNATDSVGVRNALFNWTHPDPHRRPAELSPGNKLAYLLLGFGMTLLTLLRRRPAWPCTPGEEIALCFSSLIVLMTLFSPVCHTHYLMWCVPIVMSLLASQWQFQETLRYSWKLHAVFTLFMATILVSYLPGLEILKDRCAGLFATLPLWLVPVMYLWCGRPPEVVMESPRQNYRLAA